MKKAFAVSGLLSVAVIVIVVYAPEIANALFAQDVPVLLAILLGIKTVINFCLLVTVAVLNGIYQHKRVLLYSVIGELVQLVLIWYLTAIPSLNIFGYVTAMIVGDMMRLVLNSMRLRKMTAD